MSTCLIGVKWTKDRTLFVCGKLCFGIEFDIILSDSFVEVLSVNLFICQVIVTVGVPIVFLLSKFSSGTGRTWRLQCLSPCKFFLVP